MFDFKEKVVLVTGGSRGIGKEIAEQFLQKNAKVIITYTNPSTNKEELLSQFSNNENLLIKQSNVASSEDCKELIKTIEEEIGTVDILINNAGITKDNLFMRMKEEDFDSVIDVNLKGVFNLSKLVVRKMMKKGFGRIINMSSVVALQGNPGQVNYVASKAGVIGLTMSLAKEVGSKGVTVNAVAPGFIKTDMTNKLSDEIKTHYINQIPMKRMGEAIDIASTCLFLASDMASYISAQTISVNGGMAS